MSDAPAAILLRSADDPDPYLEAFEQAGLPARCEPVLTFAFPNPSALRAHLADHDQYAGLIATSPRVATALERAVGEEKGWSTHWSDVPAYAVGPKTAARLRAIGLSPRGANAGKATALAGLIVEDAPEGPLLFLCGNRRRDTLPNRLREAGIPFDELVVYETHTRERLDLPEDGGGTWLVFFSPSGLEAVQRARSGLPAPFRIAAIGPTTAGALEEAGLAVEAVAEAPSPEGLVSAIADAETGTVPGAG